MCPLAKYFSPILQRVLGWGLQLKTEFVINLKWQAIRLATKCSYVC